MKLIEALIVCALLAVFSRIFIEVNIQIVEYQTQTQVYLEKTKNLLESLVHEEKIGGKKDEKNNN